MKKLFLMAMLACFCNYLVAQTEVKGKIEKVTVYPNSALVEKCITTSLQKGENKFIITGNATTVGTEDIHFATSPDWFVSSMQSQKEHLPAKESLAREMSQAAYNQYLTLKGQLDDVNLKISNANILVAALNQQASALNNMKALSNTQAFDTIVNLKAQFEYQRKESQAINSAKRKTMQEIEELSAKQRQLSKEIDMLVRKHTGGKTVSSAQNDIHVTIYATKNIPNARIAYSYKANQVFTGYSYDVMMDENQHQAIFSLKCNVGQNTGEHWSNCSLVFSTTDAGYAGFDGDLDPYYLDYIQTRQQNLMSRKSAAERNSAVACAREEEEMVMSMDNMQPMLAFSIVDEQTLSREYTLQNPQTIPSGESAQTILLHNDTTKVIFARYATPKIEEKVHYTALLPEWEDLGLLDANCNVYLNNRYVSTSSIVTSGSGDTMRFAVGQDPNVLVSRKLVKSSPDKNGILSKEITETATITLSLKNTKNEVVEVNIKDQIPISSASDLKVIDFNTNGGTIDEKTGIVRWEVKLQPREQKNITLTYSVKYPKEKERRVILR